MKQRTRSQLGITRLEVIAVIVAIVIITAVTFVIVSAPLSVPQSAMRLKDSTMLQQIHQSMLIWVRDYNGQYPLPGLTNRLPDPESGLDIPSKGPQDYSLNHTAPLFSMMIAHNYFVPDLVISPLEPSARVTAKDDYNYAGYDPAADSYWDTTFSADLRTTSNTSYAHMALCGERVEKYWRDTMSSVGIPMLGTRGPKDGATAGSEFANSITLQFLEPDDQWLGNVMLSDGSVLYCDSLEPVELETSSAQPFNLFRMDGGALGISIASTENNVTRVWDPLK